MFCIQTFVIFQNNAKIAKFMNKQIHNIATGEAGVSLAMGVGICQRENLRGCYGGKMGLTVWLYVRTLGGCVCVSGKHVRDVISVYACVRETLV